MKHLPIETVLHIIGYLSKPDLMSVALIASKYSILARPFLFKRIRLLFKSKVFPDWVTYISEYPDHALMIKAIEIGGYWSHSCFNGFRHLVQAAVSLEDLSIRLPREFPLHLLDPAIFSNLRRLTIKCEAEYSRLVVDFFPQCPKLIDLEVSERLSERQVRTPDFTSIIQQHAPSFMDRLHKFRGPPSFLHYMSRTGRALQHFTSTVGHTDEWSSYISKEMGFGEELLSLHVLSPSDYDGGVLDWVERRCFSPSIVPSLFPNLRSVAWFRVQHLQPGWQSDATNGAMRASAPLLSPNDELLAALKQLPHLRRVYLASHHSSYDTYDFPEIIAAFITDLQTEAQVVLPHLMTIAIWASKSAPWSYTWKKRYVDSDNGKTHLSWISATNEIIDMDC